MKSNLLAGILGGIVLFVWLAFSWMALPWHNATLHSFSNDKAVADVIIANAPQSGMYMLPAPTNEKMTNFKPGLFGTVLIEGYSDSMTMPMIFGLINLIIVALLVSWQLSKTINLNYLNRVGFVIVFGIAAFLFIDGAYWTWFKFDTKFLLVEFADAIIGWFLAGLVIAKIAR